MEIQAFSTATAAECEGGRSVVVQLQKETPLLRSGKRTRGGANGLPSASNFVVDKIAQALRNDVQCHE